MKLFIDSNVILDVLLDRVEFVKESDTIWKACAAGTFQGHISSVSLVNIFYIGSRFVGREKALLGVRLCVDTLQVCGVFSQTIFSALQMSGPDFEDNVQIAAATEAQVAAIVTRNKADFAASPIPVYTPQEFFATLQR